MYCCFLHFIALEMSFCSSNIWRIVTDFSCGFDIFMFFLSVQKKIKACHLFGNLSVYCLVQPTGLVMQDSLSGPFFSIELFSLPHLLHSFYHFQLKSRHRCALDSVAEHGADGSAAQCCLGMVRCACFPSEVATNQFRVMFYLFKYSKGRFLT